MNKTIFSFLGVLLLFFSNCQPDPACEKFIHEEYKASTSNDTLLKEAIIFRDTLRNRLKVVPIIHEKTTAYHLLYYSSHGIYYSIKFINDDEFPFIEFKYFVTGSNRSKRKDYTIEIRETDWKTVENMIYEFDFWTEEDVARTREALDGDVIFLEGFRPEADKCNKRVYQLIARGSPIYDKMGSLCNMIMEYEEDRIAPDSTIIEVESY